MEPIDDILNYDTLGNGYRTYMDYTTYARPFHETTQIKIMEGERVIDSIKDIELPPNFKTVITKMHPEIKDVVADGFKVNKRYDPSNFDSVNYFEVCLNVYIHQDEVPKGNKDFYKKSFKDLFVMTYGGEMDFISFNIFSLIVPQPKTNEQKFVELFVKDYICKK